MGSCPYYVRGWADPYQNPYPYSAGLPPLPRNPLVTGAPIQESVKARNLSQHTPVAWCRVICVSGSKDPRSPHPTAVACCAASSYCTGCSEYEHNNLSVRVLSAAAAAAVSVFAQAMSTSVSVPSQFVYCDLPNSFDKQMFAFWWREGGGKICVRWRRRKERKKKGCILFATKFNFMRSDYSLCRCLLFFFFLCGRSSFYDSGSMGNESVVVSSSSAWIQFVFIRRRRESNILILAHKGFNSWFVVGVNPRTFLVSYFGAPGIQFVYICRGVMK